MQGRTLDDSTAQAHRDLNTYWHSLRGADGWVRRGDLHPGELRRFLAHLSILEAGDEGLRFRLSGSHLRDSLGFDLRGRMLDSVGGLCRIAWEADARRALASGRPVGGVRIEGERPVHAWLRLPLLCGDGVRLLVLCHDVYRLPQTGEGLESDLFEPAQSGVIAAGGGRVAGFPGLAA